VTEVSPHAENNNIQSGKKYEYMPTIMRIEGTGNLDEAGNPLPQFEIYAAPFEVHEDLPKLDSQGLKRIDIGQMVRFLGRNSARLDEFERGDPGAAEKEFITSKERGHGGHRQKAWALWLQIHGDWDQQKRGYDKWGKYAGLLHEAKLENLDWDLFKTEIYIVAVSSRQRETNSLKYVGFCIYAKNTEEGREIIRRFEKGVKKEKQQAVTTKVVSSSPEVIPPPPELEILGEPVPQHTQVQSEAVPHFGGNLLDGGDQRFMNMSFEKDGVEPERFDVREAVKTTDWMSRKLVSGTSRPPFSSAH
jgi:hypothetical protein